MIHIEQRVRRRHVTPATWTEISNAAWSIAADFWHEKLLPKHFDRGAYREYRYQARTRAHERRKARKFGHNRPLVYSGALERQVLRAREVRTLGGAGSVRRKGAHAGTVKGGGATIRVRGPNYLKPQTRSPRMPDFAQEIRAFSNRDKQALVVELNRALQLGLKFARFAEEDA
jgi:hypothetical protein